MSEMRKERRQLWVISSVVFFGFVGLSMPYLLFPALFLPPESAVLGTGWDLPIRSILLGVTLAAYPLGQFMGAPILGVLSDEMGRRRVLVLSLLCAAGANLCTAFALIAGSLPFVIATRFLAGLMEGNLAIARAMATQLRQIDKRKAFGRIDALASISYVVGPLLGGLLADPTVHAEFTFATPFYVVSVLFVLVAVAARCMLQETRQVEAVAVRTLRERFAFYPRLQRLMHNGRLRTMLGIATLFTLAVDIFFEFGPAYLTEVWGLGPAHLARYNSLLSMALALSCGWLSVCLVQRFPQKQVIAGSMSLYSAVLSTLLLTTNLRFVAVLFFLAGVGIGIASSLLTVEVSEAAPAEIQGEVMGVQTSLRVLGDAGICLVGGLLFALSPVLVLLLAAGLVFTALFRLCRSVGPALITA